MLDIRHAFIHTNEGASPGNGSITIATPTQIVRELLYGTITLTTSADVADRYVVMYIYNPEGYLVAQPMSTGAQAASQTIMRVLQPCTGTNNMAAMVSEIDPPLVIPAGFYIKIIVTNGVVADSIVSKLTFADYQMSSKDDRSSSRRRT